MVSDPSRGSVDWSLKAYVSFRIIRHFFPREMIALFSVSVRVDVLIKIFKILFVMGNDLSSLLYIGCSIIILMELLVRHLINKNQSQII